MIDFIGKRSWFFFISAIMVIVSIASLAIFGLKVSMDFTGGTRMTLEFSSPVERSQLEDELASLNYTEASIEPAGKNSFTVEVERREILPQEKDKLVNDLEIGMNSQINVVDYYTVLPRVGSETAINSGIAVAVASVAMLVYMAWAFRKMPKPIRWGTCAIIALLHDVFIVVGIFSFLSWSLGVKINPYFIGALLTVVGYSINNTVVVYDRIRENKTIGISTDFAVTVNSSIVETLGRCLNTSLTTVFTILALFLFGGATIHYFVLALLIGVLVGTYDSMCIAGELLVTWERGEWRKISTWLPFVRQPT